MSGTDWVLAARLLIPGVSYYVVKVRGYPAGLYAVFALTPEWTRTFVGYWTGDHFPPDSVGPVEPDSPLSERNVEMEEDW